MHLFYAFPFRWFIAGDNSQRVPLFSWAKRGCLQLATAIVLASVLLTSCSGLNFNGGNSNAGSTDIMTVTPTIVTITVAKLHWCGKPLLLFRDEGASTTGGTGATNQAPTATPTPAVSSPRTINDWKQVEPNLGFTVYLPPTLPANTCLMSASATIRDPILGGSFTIGYLLPDHSAISLSEAPLRSQSSTFQCSPAPASTAGAASSGTMTSGTPLATQRAAQSLVQVCNGARNTTNIVFAAKGQTDELRRLFDALQSGVDWMPAS